MGRRLHIKMRLNGKKGDGTEEAGICYKKKKERKQSRKKQTRRTWEKENKDENGNSYSVVFQVGFCRGGAERGGETQSACNEEAETPPSIAGDFVSPTTLAPPSAFVHLPPRRAAKLCDLTLGRVEGSGPPGASSTFTSGPSD